MTAAGQAGEPLSSGDSPSPRLCPAESWSPSGLGDVGSGSPPLMARFVLRSPENKEGRGAAQARASGAVPPPQNQAPLHRRGRRVFIPQPPVSEQGRTWAGLCASEHGFFFFRSVIGFWLGPSGAGTSHAFPLCSTRWPFALLDLCQASRQVNESHWLAGGMMPPGALFKRKARAGERRLP